MIDTATVDEIQAQLEEHAPACQFAIWDNTECPVCVSLIIRLADIYAEQE